MRAVIDFSPADRFLNALPMFHSYGLTACTLMPLLCGVGLYIYTTPLRYRVIPEIAYLRDCTFLFGTSTFPGATRARPSLRFLPGAVRDFGAEKLNPDVAELWLEKFGLRIVEVTARPNARRSSRSMRRSPTVCIRWVVFCPE
jgi:acyl-[acyl-carrier-protein]-phospholipid O-acyltransferase/long-chain-fatty-acid--[acyl-carrier-protein] ligase